MLGARNRELEESVRELKTILETAEKESEEKYTALQQDYKDLQVGYPLPYMHLTLWPIFFFL